MNKKYVVKLTADERAQYERIVHAGNQDRQLHIPERQGGHRSYRLFAQCDRIPAKRPFPERQV